MVLTQQREDRNMKLTDLKGNDISNRGHNAPKVAKLESKFCIIGTNYGFLHNIHGDVKTWLSYSGARKALKKVQP